MTDRRLLITSILGALVSVAIFYGVVFAIIIPSQRRAEATNTPQPLVTLPAPATRPPQALPTLTPPPDLPTMGTNDPTIIYVVVTATPAPSTPAPPTYVVITATAPPLFPYWVTPPCPCDRNRYNCGHWDNKPDMLACYDYCMILGRGDIHDLDGDGDGLPCEHLR